MLSLNKTFFLSSQSLQFEGFFFFFFFFSKDGQIQSKSATKLKNDRIMAAVKRLQGRE